jgi:transmembrane sensor
MRIAKTTLMAPTPDIVRQAAEWAALLDGGTGAPDQLAACEAWCGESPMHRLAFERMQALDARFDGLTGSDRQVLRRLTDRKPKARLLSGGGALAAAVMLVGCGWLATHLKTVREHFADYQTERGEQRAIRLADNSNLVVDTASAASASLSRGERRISLFRGQVLANVARDANRPFIVETADATATALGTVFTVRVEAGGTRVTVLESRVKVCPRSSEICAEVGEGTQVLVSADEVSPARPVNVEQAGAWSNGWLEVDDQPVSDVLSELDRYSAQRIRFDPALLRNARVTGSYPLGDPARALEAIAGTARLKVERQADGSVVVTPRS